MNPEKLLAEPILMVRHSGSCLQLAAKPVQAPENQKRPFESGSSNVQRMDNWNAKDMVKKYQLHTSTCIHFQHIHCIYSLVQDSSR